jgi:hypothetical protein
MKRNWKAGLNVAPKRSPSQLLQVVDNAVAHIPEADPRHIADASAVAQAERQALRLSPS